jgi:hypothetical protein
VEDVADRRLEFHLAWVGDAEKLAGLGRVVQQKAALRRRSELLAALAAGVERDAPELCIRAGDRSAERSCAALEVVEQLALEQSPALASAPQIPRDVQAMREWQLAAAREVALAQQQKRPMRQGRLAQRAEPLPRAVELRELQARA